MFFSISSTVRSKGQREKVVGHPKISSLLSSRSFIPVSFCEIVENVPGRRCTFMAKKKIKNNSRRYATNRSYLVILSS